MDTIKLFELPSTSTYVLLPEKIQKQLFLTAAKRAGGLKELKEIISEKSKKYGLNYRNEGGVYSWAVLRRRFLPLWILIEICKITDRNQSFIQNKVIAIKKYESGKEVGVKFPLEITPEFDSIVANLLGDGSFGVENEICATYKQKNKISRDLFTTKLKNVFGNFQVNERQSEKFWQIIIPKIIIDTILSRYSIKETKTLTRRVPEEIKNKARSFKVAFLSSFIIDEGHVNGGIEIYSGNKLLLYDVLEITKSLGYEVTEIKEKKGHYSINNYYRFRIKTGGCRRFLKDLYKLGKYYPTCNLAQKQKELEYATNRIRHRTPDGYTKRRILEELKEGDTVRNLKYKLNVTNCTLIEHLVKLEKQSLVTRVGKEGNAIVWQANKS